MGYGVIESAQSKLHYVASGCIRVTEDTLAQRLQQIFTGVREVIAQFQPEVISIEEAFMGKNANSAIKLGQARGVAIVAASQDGLSVYEYSPREVKQAVVGYGAAEKTQVQQMVKVLLKLSGVPQSDAADALGIAICHANTQKYLKENQR